DPDRDPDEQQLRNLPGRRSPEGEAARQRPRAVCRGRRPHRHRDRTAPRADVPPRDLTSRKSPATLARDPVRGRLMVGRLTLDQEVGVRIPAPQPTKPLETAAFHLPRPPTGSISSDASYPLLPDERSGLGLLRQHAKGEMNLPTLGGCV